MLVYLHTCIHTVLGVGYMYMYMCIDVRNTNQSVTQKRNEIFFFHVVPCVTKHNLHVPVDDVLESFGIDSFAGDCLCVLACFMMSIVL